MTRDMCAVAAGVKEAGYPGPPVPAYDVTVGTAVVPPTRQNLTSFMNALLAALRALDESYHFREPVDGDEVTDYYDIIKNPMDLGTMQVRPLAARAGWTRQPGSTVPSCGFKT